MGESFLEMTNMFFNQNCTTPREGLKKHFLKPFSELLSLLFHVKNINCVSDRCFSKADTNFAN